MRPILIFWSTCILSLREELEVEELEFESSDEQEFESSEDEGNVDVEACFWFNLELDFNGLSFCLLFELYFVILIG